MIKGATITAKIPNTWHYDRFNNKVVDEYEPITVDNVLIVPGATSGLEASRPEGVSVAFTLHFPKTFSGSLECALVVLPEPYNGTYRVIGNPRPYMGANTPTPWHMPVEVEEAHG